MMFGTRDACFASEAFWRYLAPERPESALRSEAGNDLLHVDEQHVAHS